MTDKEIGLKVFRSYWNWSRAFNGSSFNYSFEQFLKVMQPNQKKLDILLDGVGGGVREAGVSDSRIETAMRSLAKSSGGKIPSNPMQFFYYLSNEATKINWLDATAFVVTESAKDIIKGAQSVGDSIITSAKIINFLLPAIALIFVFFWINKATDGSVVKVVRSFKK